jgi:putative transposase
MNFTEKDIYHIYNRGNNSQKLFFEEENYTHFLKLVKKFLSPNCEILVWCLMPNHFHFLIYANEKSAQPLPSSNIPIQQLSESIRLLLSSYTKAINKKYNRTGNLFQQKTKCKNVYDGKGNYAAQAFHYIHQNPIKSFLVKDMREWEYSSYKDYAGLRNGSLCNKELAIQLLDIDINNFERYSNNFIRDFDERKIT